MTAAPAARLAVASPQETWQALRGDPHALLVDVRTRAEWAFVGAPDLRGAAGGMAFVEWARLPAMSPNPDFVAETAQAAVEAGATRIFFLCRSGARSAAAATAMQAHFDAQGAAVACINVAEGFEGDLDADGHRGAANGWKARALPWRQT